MAKSRLLRPQFFLTLVPGFHTHLMIPEDLFSKYIEGRSAEKKTAELKSDASDITWRVKMTGRRLSDGWGEFALANNLQIGNVVLVRYKGDMVFHVSNLGLNCCQIQDIPPPSNNNFDKYDIDNQTLLKKRLCPRTQVEVLSNDGDSCDDEEDIELPVKKRMKMKSPEAEAVSSSSSDNSCFVAVVTPSSLRTDKLYLPQHFTRSNGLTRKCQKIVLIDGEGNSWALDLRFNKASDTFYMTRGWRNFCDENGQEAGGFFMFKLVVKAETIVLSFCPTESYSDKSQRDYSEASRRESFSTELSSEEESIEGESSEYECNSIESLTEIEKKKCNPKRTALPYSSYSPCHKRFVTYTLPPDYVTFLRLTLPKPFVKENGMNKPGEIYLLGKDGTKWPTSLILSNRGIMSLGKGWKEFVKANGLESGFTLELKWEDTTPVFSLCCSESISDREQEEYFEAIKKQSLFMHPSNIVQNNKTENNTEESLKQFVTLTITPSSFVQCKLRLPNQFVTENGLNKPGMIYLLGEDDTKWMANLVEEKDGRMSLRNGWTVFAKANDFKPGECVTVESIWEDETPMIRFLRTGSKSSKANKKEESISTEDTEPRERDSSSAIQDRRFVTLTQTPEDVSACMLILPSQFLKANGINRLGKITILGENKMETYAYLLSREGIVALDIGWKKFCEANGVKLGESFTLEFINEQDKTIPKFCFRETNRYKNC